MIGALIIGAFGLVGLLDYNAEIADLAIYCENVKRGAWPDYKKIYKKECAQFNKTLDNRNESSKILIAVFYR